MPLQSYICKKCGEKFDLLVGMIQEKPKFECQKCGSKNIQKTLGTFSMGKSDNQDGSSCSTGTCPTCFQDESKIADFKEIDESKAILELTKYAALKEIVEAYRELVLKYHPDRCKGKNKKECEEKFKQISYAKDLLSVYFAGYRYSFKEKDVKRSFYDKDFYKCFLSLKGDLSLLGFMIGVYSESSLFWFGTQRQFFLLLNFLTISVNRVKLS